MQIVMQWMCGEQRVDGVELNPYPRPLRKSEVGAVVKRVGYIIHVKKVTGRFMLETCSSLLHGPYTRVTVIMIERSRFYR